MFKSIMRWLPQNVVNGYIFFQNVTQAMRIVCQILTKDPDGSAYRIPFEIFTTLFKYLASLNREISQAQVEAVLSHLQEDV